MRLNENNTLTCVPSTDGTDALFCCRAFPWTYKNTAPINVCCWQTRENRNRITCRLSYSSQLFTKHVLFVISNDFRVPSMTAKPGHCINRFNVAQSHICSIGVARGPCPLKFLAYLVILCFEIPNKIVLFA